MASLWCFYYTLSKSPGDMRPGGFPVDKFAEIAFPVPNYATPVIKRLYPQWYLKKVVAFTEIEYF